MIGIYKITKIENRKSYIGKSNDIERRFKEHQTKGKTSRIPLDEAIEKYGINAFTYEIIEECSLDKLNEREQY
jgi:group I intron endonuclease